MKHADLIMEMLPTVKGIKYVAMGRSVEFALDDARVVKISLESSGSSSAYDGILISLYSKTIGKITGSVIWFSDCFEVPTVCYKGITTRKHIKRDQYGFTQNDDWYGVRPSNDDFKRLRDTVRSFINLWK